MSNPKPSFPNVYLVVTDKDSKILKSTSDFYEAVRIANLIRSGGGEVTIFKATRG